MCDLRWNDQAPAGLEAIAQQELPSGIASIRLVDRFLTAKGPAWLRTTGAQDAQIDQRVYALYGLTEEEIATIEVKI